MIRECYPFCPITCQKYKTHQPLRIQLSRLLLVSYCGWKIKVITRISPLDLLRCMGANCSCWRCSQADDGATFIWAVVVVWVYRWDKPKNLRSFYKELEIAIEQGYPVIADSFCALPEQRAGFENLADKLSVNFYGLWVTAPAYGRVRQPKKMYQILQKL